MKEIPVSGGFTALVDDADFELVSGYSWNQKRDRNSRTIYATAYVRGSRPLRRRLVRLHRLIMDAPPGVEVDHKDGNGLNCQRDNLRLATSAQNKQNIPKHRTANGIPTSSKYKGVCWDKSRGRWSAYASLNEKCQHLGRFLSEADAAAAYNAFAIKHYGEFAVLNG